MDAERYPLGLTLVTGYFAIVLGYVVVQQYAIMERDPVNDWLIVPVCVALGSAVIYGLLRRRAWGIGVAKGICLAVSAVFVVQLVSWAFGKITPAWVALPCLPSWLYLWALGGEVIRPRATGASA